MRKSLNIENKFVVGHVGRFTYQKNHGFLIDVFSEIHKINPKAVLLLIGDAVGDMSYYENVKQKVEQYSLTECVQFLGMRNDVPLLMQAMDCFALPSRFEGLPCFFSNTITREVGLTGLAHFISLEDPSAKWAEKITAVNAVNREKAANQVRLAGYDIESVVQKMQNFYLT